MSRTKAFSCQDSETLGWERERVDLQSNVHRWLKADYRRHPAVRDCKENEIVALAAEPQNDR